jgi:hypothetical protein
VNCELCGSLPAQEILLQSASSRIIWWNHRKIKAALCGICSERVFFDQQSRNLIQGWWGPLSALATIWFTGGNYLRINEHRRSITEVETDAGLVARPHLKISANRLAMVVSGIALLVIFSIGSSILNTPTPVSDSSPDSFVASCWEDMGNNDLKQVACSSDNADYETYQVVNDSSLCMDSYLRAGAEFACLRAKY